MMMFDRSVTIPRYSMSAADIPRPLAVRREGDGLAIDWADGLRTFVSFSYLRSNCPCATCADERAKPVDPFRILKPEEVAAGSPRPVAMHPRGHYAYQIV